MTEATYREYSPTPWRALLRDANAALGEESKDGND